MKSIRVKPANSSAHRIVTRYDLQRQTLDGYPIAYYLQRGFLWQFAGEASWSSFDLDPFSYL
jgi:hypothetical protein